MHHCDTQQTTADIRNALTHAASCALRAGGYVTFSKTLKYKDHRHELYKHFIFMQRMKYKET